MNQVTFLLELLNEIDKYNQEANDNSKINLQCCNSKDLLKDFEIVTTSQIREILPKMITKNVIIEEEKIIGKTCNREQIKQNLIFHISLEDCTNIKELTDTLSKCMMYYQDSFYQDVFCEMFPKYPEIMYLVGLLRELNIDDKKVQNVTFGNVEEVFYNSIKNVLKTKKSYDEVSSFLIKLNYLIPENKIKNFFPNLKLITSLSRDICPFEEEDKKNINELLSGASSYEEISKIIFELGYTKKQKRLAESEESLLSFTETLENIKQRKNIISHKEKLNKLINKRKELEQQSLDCEFEITTIEIALNTEKTNINNHNKIIADSSSNIFKRIINRKKIKNSRTAISESESKTEKLESNKEKLNQKITKIKEEIILIEKRFKTITNLDFVPSDVSFMQSYYEPNHFFDETELENSIINLKQEIERLKKEIAELIQTGLIILDDKQLQDSNQTTILDSELIKHSHPKKQ